MVYKIRDDAGEVIQGSFYAQELQKVNDSGVYRIRRVLRRKGNKALVAWEGYSDQFNSWIPWRNIRKNYKS